jgi:glycosyltransferase involved in cell wall biosynthesis
LGRDQKIKVCHIISGDLWAGAEVQAYTLLKTLKGNSHLELSAIVLNEGRLSEKLREAGIETVIIDESKNRFLSLLRKSREYLDGKKVDIIHSHRRKENVLAGLLRRSRHVVHAVQTVHGASEPFKGIKWLKEKVYAVLNRYFTNRYFDHILPVSDDLRTLVSGSLDRGRLTTVHNAIDLGTVNPSRSAGETRRTLGLDENQPVIGSAGRMVPVKGFDVFLGAARIILETKPETAFVLAGDGPLFSQIKQLAKTLGVENNVQFLGFRDDITDILNCLDIFVVSSHHEGVPTVLLEAMALRKGIVATAVGGVNEIIEPDESGILVQAGDADAIAEACQRILVDSDLREKLGSAARTTVENEFSSVVQAKRVSEIYAELTGYREAVTDR